TGVLEAPVHLALPAVDIQREAYIEIRDRRDRHVVTVLDLLSPTNKTKGPDRDQYLGKRGQILASSTHFVEIDLLRGGARPPQPGLPHCDYYALVSRSQDRPDCGFWPFGIREPLPRVPIPLSPPDRRPFWSCRRCYTASSTRRTTASTSTTMN